MLFSKQEPKCLVLLSLLFLGILVALPLTNFQDYLAQGDHGRDLYAAEAVYRGEKPFKDFWWVYGPLTPYYYGLFFKIFGTQIPSMLIGKLVVKVIGSMIMALALLEISSPAMALLGGCWFLLFQQDFFFTNNHLCGLVMVLGVALCLLSYIKGQSIQSAWGALAFIFLLCLIKVNFGLAALVLTMLTVAVVDVLRRTPVETPKKLFYIAALAGVPLLTFLIYWSLLNGLSAMEIRQCLPYKEGDQPYDTNPLIAVLNFLKIIWGTVKSNWSNAAIALIIIASFLRTLYLFAGQRLSGPRKNILLLSLAMLTVFYFFNAHEYLKSGVWYRLFWAQPISMLITFILIDTAAQSVPLTLRKLLLVFLTVLAVWGWWSHLRVVESYKTGGQFLSLPRARLYMANQPSWITTVEQTTDFLNKTLAPGELFFALPYDCLYYYLTGKRTPTRQLIFFEHIKIPTEQEQAVIAELEKNRVHYVLVSSRAFARQEYGLGFLGSTYCPLIGKYIQDHFSPVARFGDWTNEPGWAWNHGTIIFKRKGI